MDTYAILGLGLTSIICLYLYRHELGKYACPKDFWTSKTSMAFSGPVQLLDLIGWNLIILCALPAGIIWRISTWMIKSFKS